MLKKLPQFFAIVALRAALLVPFSPAGAAHTGNGGSINRRAAIAAQEAHTDALLAQAGIVGTSVGLGAGGEPAITVYTVAPGLANLSAKLDGVPVQAVVTGRSDALDDPTARFPRPVPIGVSVGHPDITAGTIGERVKDAAGNVYVLSNNHVRANTNKAGIGDDALQPGPFDGGTSAYAIASLSDFETIQFIKRNRAPLNYIDAAIAGSSTANLGVGTPNDGYGAPTTTTVSASLGKAVYKYVRTTGLTSGLVQDLNVTVEHLV